MRAWATHAQAPDRAAYLCAIKADSFSIFLVGETLVGLHQEAHGTGEFILLTWDNCNVEFLAGQVN